VAEKLSPKAPGNSARVRVDVERLDFEQPIAQLHKTGDLSEIKRIMALDQSKRNKE
jgi:hypothetical protein